ncbi:ABC transporter substrate-binding protein [Vandammella animalimorsus]|uniref:ABC transporter substrate-binding protein n=1 Tax=Vandammella animalimorsus TaxID=2029117 RepID=A0A3M6RU30_9BURK|nr:ABC transporter substrate-binding protein [Vandammella animalimorsus]RMX18807.1 ABC transporter substrate-binding protein [Vandammella animalimorsus]
MKKRNFLSACASALLLAYWSPASAQDTIRIGAVLPLTGPSATIGEDMRRGIQIGIEQVNANGGVLGKKLAVIVEDSANNPTTALTAARKLATVDKVPVVLGEFSSSITLPMAQYLVKEGVAHVNIGSSSVKVRDLGETAFNLIGLENAGNAFAAQDVFSQGYRNVALITPNNAYGQGVGHGFKDEFEKLGGKVVAQILYTGGQSSYRRELQQLSRANPDVYVYSSYGHESAVINREAKELGLRDKTWYAYIMSMCVSDTPAEIAEGQIGMELGSVKGELGESYEKAFKASFKEGFASVFNGYAYDGIFMVATAINQAGGSSSIDVQKGLKKLSEQGFLGVTGPIRLDKQGQRIDPPYDKLKFVGGRLVAR